MAEQPEHSWRQTLKRRLAVATGVILLWSVAIEARLVYLQVLQHDALVAAAEDQQSDLVPLPAKRGDIFDRNGRTLGYNVDADSVFAVPRDVEKPEATVAALCAALGDCRPQDRETYLTRLNKRDKKGRRSAFANLSRWITPEQAARVATLELDGIFLRQETKRYYPNRELASHLLGYVGDDNTGLAGIEEKYDWLVGGEAGQALVHVDARQVPFFSRLEKPPTAGASLVLTVDEYVQHVVERELSAGVKWSGAEAGFAVVMDPFSGEILALANVPTFNPNAFKRYSDDERKNRALQDVYEPGSTLKFVTAGAALEEGLATPSDLIHTSPGVIRFGARAIDEAGGHNYGTLTFEDVIVKSSNVGAIKIGLQLGADRLSSYVSRFGFGARSSPNDFRGDSRGIVWNAADLTDSDVASVSMGYTVSVTALQMAAAASAVANGGELVEPRVVREVIRDGVRTPVPRKVVRRVISAGTAKQLTTILEAVVERGTATAAQIEGFTIAGKTGTAAKAIPGGYSTTDYNVSFVGFVPSRNPAFTILVVIDSPHKVSAYGGTVAAPVFQKIAAALLRHRGVPPSLNPPAPVIVARHEGRRHEGQHSDQAPQPVSGPAAPAIVTVADNTTNAPAVFPDLVGLSARDAVRVLARLGLSPRLHGSGQVVTQRPAPGSALELIASATLWLERRPRLNGSVSEAQSRALDAAGVPRGRP